MRPFEVPIRSRWRGLVICIFIVCVGLIVLGSLDADFRFAGSARYGWALHILAYAAVTPVAGAAIRSLWKAAVLLFLLSLVLEALQHFMPWRHVDLNDVLANALGIALGVLIAVGIQKFQNQMNKDQ